MGLTRRDAATTALSALAVLVFLANSRSWDVPLLGDNRWAIAALGLLGLATCTVGARLQGSWTGAMIALGALGGVALILLVLGLITGSQAMLTALLAVLLVLWAGSTVRHAAGHVSGRPVRTA